MSLRDHQAFIEEIYQSIFDKALYLRQNPDVRQGVELGQIDALQHFLLFGKFEQRAFSPVVDLTAYVNSSPDLTTLFADGYPDGPTPFDHWLNYGIFEDRPLSVPGFDAGFYLQQYPDVESAVRQGQLSAVQHFLQFGLFEARSISPFINLSDYLQLNPDLQEAMQGPQPFSPFLHLLNHGLAEGRPLGQGITLASFANDTVFQQALANENTQAVLARLAEVTPFLPSFQRPAGWAPATNLALPYDFTPVAGEKLTVPEGVTVPEGTLLNPDVWDIPPLSSVDPEPAPIPPLRTQWNAAQKELTVSGTSTDDVVVSIDTGNDTITITQAGDAFIVYDSVESGRVERIDATSYAGDIQVEGLALADWNVTITGGSGNDVLQGGSGDDTLQGGAGADAVTGGYGADMIDLGAADNAIDRVIYLAPGETATGDYAGGPGTSPMDVITGASIGDVIQLWVGVIDLATTVSTTYQSGPSSNGVSIVRGIFDTANHQFDASEATDADDYLLQWAYGNSEKESVILKDFGLLAPSLVLSAASHTLTISPVYNVITGTPGDDTLNAGDGYDMIIGGAGKDTMYGGDGDDVFIIASAADHGNTNNGERIYGEGGTDTIRFTSVTPNDTLNLSYWIDVEEVRIVAADGSENPTEGLGINADWLGVGPNITLYGNAGSNRLVGNGDGVNIIYGGAGDDTLIGGFLADSLFGEAGNDTLRGGSGNDTIDGGAGADIIQFAAALDFGQAGDATANGSVYWAVGVDAITFDANEDAFLLHEAVFGVLGNDATIGADGGTLAASQFESVSGTARNLAGTLDTSGNGAIVYDTVNNGLYFLANGAANATSLTALLEAGSALKIADITLVGALNESDFLVVQ